MNIEFIKPVKTLGTMAKKKRESLPIVLRAVRFNQRMYFVDEAMFTGG